MSRNQAGNYTLPLPPVVPGDVIESQWANATTSDLAEGLTQSLDRSGRGAMLAPLILSSDPIVQPFQATSKAYVDKFLSYATGMPIAAITHYSANGAIPPAWLLCDGQAVSRTTYPDLFAAIGTIYGAGDGSTTFNLPNLTNEFIRGFGAGRTLGVAQNGAILAHAHGITDQTHSHRVIGVSESNNASHTHTFNASTNSAGAHSHNVVSGGVNSGNGAFADATPRNNVATSTDGAHSHTVSGTTSGESNIHKHSISIESEADATGITITQSTGGGENIPRNMPMFYIIKAIKDGTSTITPVLAITTTDAAMISVTDTDPTVPVLNIHSNVPFGIPKLDANAKVPLAQIPNLTSNNLGFFDASPGLLPVGTFASGDTYTISVAGTLNLYDPVTLVAAPTVVPVGTDITYITGSPTNPTGWYAAPLQTNVAASAVAFTPGGTIAAGNVQAAIAELDSETQAALSGKATATPSAFSAFVLGVAVSGFANSSPLVPTQINVNEGGEYNPATGRFTCAVAGLYQFNLNIGVVGAAAPTFTGLYSVLLRNGMYWVYGSGFGNVSVPEATSAGSTLIYLQPGDYVQCAVTGQFGAGCTLNVDEFSGFFVRRMP